MSARRRRRAFELGAAVSMACLLGAACSDSDASLVTPAATTVPVAPTLGSSDSSIATATDSSGAATTEAPPDGSVDAVTTTRVMPTTGTSVVTTPMPIEDTLADPADSWPTTAGAPPGATRIAFADGTDNPVSAPILQPPVPAVPHATATAAGGATVVRVTGFEFPDAAAAQAWAATWTPYAADEAGELPGGVYVERHPVVAPAPWTGFTVDALYAGRTQWQRTAMLGRTVGRRGYTVSVRWFGDPAAGVPELTADIAALANAQDEVVDREGIGPGTPGTGAEGGVDRLALTELAAPWAALLAQPDIDPAAGSQTLLAEAANGETLPAGASADSATAVAARVACSARGCPVFSVVTQFPSPSAARAAAARWALPEAGLGPLEEVAFPQGATVTGVTPVDTSALPGASALTATLSDGVGTYQAGAGWFVRGDRVYGVLSAYPSTTRNAEVTTAMLTAHSSRLDALGVG